jgi:RNA polymerase sigma-70 factor (ECF subfamily)
MTEDSGEDERLARAVGAGEAGAEDALCRRFVPRVFAYGLRHLRDRDAAFDLTQTVMCIVLEKLRSGDVTEPERLASFVLGTSRNVVRSWRRDASRRHAILDRAAPVLAELARAELDSRPFSLERLASCIEGLTPRQRTVIMLTFYAQCDAMAIAEELGTSSGNVRVVRHRTLATLRGCLEGGHR